MARKRYLGVLCALFVCLAAMAQTPLGPGQQSYYRENGPRPVRVYDGGTGARTVTEARKNLDVPTKTGTDQIPGNWAMTGSLVTPYTLATDSSWNFRDNIDTTKKVRLELGGMGSGVLGRLCLPSLYQFNYASPWTDTLALLNNANNWQDSNTFFSAVEINGTTLNVTNGSGIAFNNSTGQTTYLVSPEHAYTSPVQDTLPTYYGSLVAAPGYGTSGQVLTSNGYNTAPTWQAAGGSTDEAASYRWTGRNTVRDDKWFMQDGADTTKKLQVVADSITASTTRKWTALDADGTVPLVIARKDSSVVTDASVSWTILKSAKTGWYELKVAAMDRGNGGSVGLGYTYPNSVLGTSNGTLPVWDENAGLIVTTANMGLASQASFDSVHRFWVDTVGDITVLATTAGGGQVDVHARLEYLGR